MAWRLIQATRARHMFCTLGKRGLVVFDRPSQDDQSPQWSDRLQSEHFDSFADQCIDRLGCGDAMLAAATLYMRRVPGVIRPAIAVVIPSVRGQVVLLDAGASAEARPEHYPQYAMMGRLFAQDVLGIPEPRVGLLSIGEEEGRGNETVQAAYALLRDTPGFVGNVEGRDINRGLSDVVVTDGFTGNVVLKALEGAAWYLMTEMRSAVTRTLPGRVGALLVRPSLRRMRQHVDPENYGGAYLLGVRGLAVIGHGNSSGEGIANAVRLAAQGAREDLVTHFAAALGAERAPSA